MHTYPRILSAVVVALLFPLTGAGPVAMADTSDASAHARWSWPLTGPRAVSAPYRAPAHEYGAGHRGVDLAASVGAEVTAPADGVVAFRGTVVDRPLLTIEHPGGLVTTFEPVRSTLVAGDLVTAGQTLGVVDTGGHTPAGSLHLGVRRDGDYINPLLLFGEVPRAVLQPCCDGS
ncbi:murein hydrolase activator EnvC family protein [Microbacterium sp. NPDC091662]|uniref:murein hydrolase activator EnvC family protein n=1 Tax=Microbacterium sp. NPDC091662 TaxID=3364211 RepID=UPI00381D41A7